MKSASLNLEARDRKKSMRISLGLHALILLLAIFPFLNNMPDMDPQTAQMVVAIDFSHSSSSAENKSAARSGAAKKVEEVKPLEAPEIPKEEEIVEEEVVEKTETADVEAESSEMEELLDAIEEILEEAESATEEIEEVNDSEVESNDSQEIDSAEESAENEGEGSADEGSESGSEDIGDSDDSQFGNNGDGKEGFDESGDGIFGRQVIKHAPLSKIMKESGRIAVKVCINPAGFVKEVSLIKEETTIDDRIILIDALHAASEYVFEKDIESRGLQCGKLTFVLDIQTNSFLGFFE